METNSLNIYGENTGCHLGCEAQRNRDVSRKRLTCLNDEFVIPEGRIEADRIPSLEALGIVPRVEPGSGLLEETNQQLIEPALVVLQIQPNTVLLVLRRYSVLFPFRLEEPIVLTHKPHIIGKNRIS